MSPFSPTAQPVKRSPRQTDTSLGLVLTLNGSHDLPPSPVSQTIPLLSVMDPFDASPNERDNSSERLYILIRSQVAPASSLRATQPPNPAATIVVSERYAASDTTAPAHGSAAFQFSPSLVVNTVPFKPDAT